MRVTTLTQPLREEHRELIPHIEMLRTVADALDEMPVDALRRGVDDVYAFLAHHLLPHAQAEEAALYPAAARLLGGPQATATMSRDHVEVEQLIDGLADLRDQLAAGPLNDTQTKALRRVLYGLYALIRVHFAKEEEVYLPILDEGLTPTEAQEMFKAMERAAKAARRGSED